MIKLGANLWRWGTKTLRFYLTAWYALLLIVTLFLFSIYLYFTLRHSLIKQLDDSLQITASETLALVTQEGEKLKFKPLLQDRNINQYFTEADVVLLLLDQTGNICDQLGDIEINQRIIKPIKGYLNISINQQTWRIYSQKININQAQGWLQVGQSFTVVSEATSHLLKVIIFSFPLVLIIISLGGLFLADRAFSPIDDIITTTEMITANNFTTRINYQGTFTEISKLSFKIDEMLNRLQTAFDNQKRFTADVSHELRTPLTIMKGKIEVTLNKERNVQSYQNNLQELEIEVNRLIRLVNSLLFLGELQQQENEYYLLKSEINLSNLLEILAEQIEILAEYKQIEFQQKISQNMIISGNADYLTRLFLNLLDNALKYTPPKQKVTIITAENLNYYIISIINTGTYIEPEHIPHLFERFYRTEIARSRQTGGTGLGLAIAEEIAILHDGFIEVHSSLSNQETNFKVYLPKI